MSITEHKNLFCKIVAMVTCKLFVGSLELIRINHIVNLVV